MLDFTLVAVGEKMPPWLDEGFRGYQKRIRGSASLNLIEVPAVRRGKNPDLARIIRDEEQKISELIPPGNHVIALDRKGKTFSTLELTERCRDWMQDGVRISLIIGGPEGLSENFLSGCDETWSLSTLTFAHPIVRIMVAEQLYRCLSIIDGSPYHR